MLIGAEVVTQESTWLGDRRSYRLTDLYSASCGTFGDFEISRAFGCEAASFVALTEEQMRVATSQQP